MIEILELLKTKIPEGFSLYPNRDENYKQLRYSKWSTHLHYEILEKRNSINLEIHLESQSLNPFVEIVKSYVEPLKDIPEFQQANKNIEWDSLWRVNKGGIGALKIIFPKTTFPSVIVSALLKLIELTFDDINNKFDDINNNLPENISLNQRDKTKYNQNIIQVEEVNVKMTFEHKDLNIILYGPPGTGKTFNSINYAVSIIENKDFKDIEKESEIDRNEIENRFNNYREKGLIEFVTFHQNYSYEDFIQGLKPDVENNSQLTFTKKDGIFKTLCERAIKASNFQDVYEKFIEKFQTFPNNILNLKTKTHGKDFTVKINSKGNFIAQPNTTTATEMVILKESLENYLTNGMVKVNDWKPYLIPISDYIRENFDLQINDNSKDNFVIIIDEINRANISRVFGELITLIENDKRGKLKVTLPSGELFTVPKNLYIIGTMNTADKSIALLDIALRRRFKFISKYTDYSKIPLFKDYLKPINDEIKKRKKSPDFMIGHSYFINKKKEDLPYIFNNEIIPLLNEYFNNKLEVVEEVLKSSNIQYEIDQDTYQIVVKE